LHINEDIAYSKIISSKNVTKSKTIGKYLFEIKCKSETKFGGGTTPPRLARSENAQHKNGSRIEKVMVS
jgi:hypothetical protein